MSDFPKAKIQLNGEFSATELEAVIRTLAEARAGLDPPVPDLPPTELSTDEILVQSEAKFRIRKIASGGLRIWLRNEGIGWLAFTMSTTDKLGLLEFLSKDIGHEHSSH